MSTYEGEDGFWTMRPEPGEDMEDFIRRSMDRRYRDMIRPEAGESIGDFKKRSDRRENNMRQTIEEVDMIKKDLKPGEMGPGLKADSGKRDLVLFPWETVQDTTAELVHQELAEYLGAEDLDAAYIYILENDHTSINGITQVMEFGAKKYAPNNWQNVRPGIRYVSGALRHLMAIEGIPPFADSPEEFDPESGLRHWDHLGCCVAFAKWQKDQGYNLWESDAG